MNTDQIIKKSKILMKLAILYVLVLVLFYKVKSNEQRFFLSMLLYVLALSVFHINFKTGIFYFFMAIFAALTEHVFINFMHLSWEYKKPDFLLLPCWLVPLWALAILMISRTVI